VDQLIGAGHVDRLFNIEIMIKGEGKKIWKEIEEEK